MDWGDDDDDLVLQKRAALSLNNARQRSTTPNNPPCLQDLALLDQMESSYLAAKKPPEVSVTAPSQQWAPPHGVHRDETTPPLHNAAHTHIYHWLSQASITHHSSRQHAPTCPPRQRLHPVLAHPLHQPPSLPLLYPHSPPANHRAPPLSSPTHCLHKCSAP